MAAYNLLVYGNELYYFFLKILLTPYLAEVEFPSNARVNEGKRKFMPTALRIGPYRFYFYSYDCDEPRHMHVDRENKSAKFWLDPDVSLAENYGYSRKALRDIERIARENLERLKNEWDAFCGDNTRTA